MIRASHEPSKRLNGDPDAPDGYCDDCGFRWPCEGVRLLATLDAARAGRDGLRKWATHETSCKGWTEGDDDRCTCGLTAALAAQPVTRPDGLLREAREVVRKRLHNTMPDDSDHALGKTDHARDLNAKCNGMARWIVDDVIAALSEGGSEK